MHGTDELTFLWYIYLWVALSAIGAAIAYQRGRSAVGAGIICLAFSPVVGIPIALILDRDDEVLEARKLNNKAVQRCPSCAELVKRAARVCRYCGTDLDAHKKAATPKAELTLGEMKDRGIIR